MKDCESVNQEIMKTRNALLGLLAGVAAGAALGVMFAPGKGRDTRKKVVKKGEDLADAIDERIDRKFDELEMRFDDLMRGFIGKVTRVKSEKDPRKPEMTEFQSN